MQRFSAPQLCLLRMFCALLDHSNDVDVVHEWHPSRIDVAVWMVSKHSDGVGFLPPSYVQQGMSCCSTSTTSCLPLFLSVVFLFRGEVADWSTSKKVTQKIARGLYVCDHASKILTSVLAQQLIPSYVKFVSPCQFGAKPQMGVPTRSVPLWKVHGCMVIPQQCCTWICRKPLASPFAKRSWACRRASSRIACWNTCVTLAALRKTCSSNQQRCVTKLCSSPVGSLVLLRDSCILFTQVLGACWMAMNTPCPHVEEADKAVSTVCFHHGVRHGPLLISSETHVAHHVCSGVSLHDNLFWVVSRSAKILPSVGKS